MLSVTQHDYGISQLETGTTSLLSHYSMAGTPLLEVINLDYSNPARNICMYFTALGDTSLFDYLIANGCLKINYSAAHTLTDWINAFISFNYTITSSFANSLANKWIISKSTVYKYGTGITTTDGYIPAGVSGFTHFLRYNIEIPSERPYFSGSIDAIYVYTYIT